MQKCSTIGLYPQFTVKSVYSFVHFPIVSLIYINSVYIKQMDHLL